MNTEPLGYVFEETANRCDFLVVWLHGLGADGYDFVPLANSLELPMDRGYRFVFPHAEERPITINGGMKMRGWYDILSLDRLHPADHKGIDESCRKICDLIEQQVTEMKIGYDRVIVGGFSQGGAISLHLGLRFPLKLAGVASLSSYIFSESDLTAERNPANVDTPVFLSHGVQDDVLPYELGLATETFLKRSGQPFVFHKHPEGHAVPMGIIGKLGSWLSGITSGTKVN